MDTVLSFGFSFIFVFTRLALMRIIEELLFFQVWHFLFQL